MGHPVTQGPIRAWSILTLLQDIIDQYTTIRYMHGDEVSHPLAVVKVGIGEREVTMNSAVSDTVTRAALLGWDMLNSHWKWFTEDHISKRTACRQICFLLLFFPSENTISFRQDKRVAKKKGGGVVHYSYVGLVV